MKAAEDIMQPLPPVRFKPLLKSVIWGGERIKDFKNLDTSQTMIGESWEVSAVSGRESIAINDSYRGLNIKELGLKYGARLFGYRNGADFPLLIKIIDAHADLSLQVHPDDKLARKRHGCPGKTEMWYVIDAKPGATVIDGFSEDLERDGYLKMAQDGSVLNMVNTLPSAPGDIFFLPAGRIHGIGAGNLLMEIQQSSDISYRIHDYGRRDANGNMRELHTSLAAEALDMNKSNACKAEGRRLSDDVEMLAECPYFHVYHFHPKGKPIRQSLPEGSFLTLTCIEGELHVKYGSYDETLSRGETILIPAEAREITIEGMGRAVGASI